jgi:hypothetical protein
MERENVNSISNNLSSSADILEAMDDSLVLSDVS